MKPWQQNLEAAYSFKVDCCKKTVWGQDRPCQAGWPAYQRPKGRANACTALNCDLLLLCQHDHCESNAFIVVDHHDQWPWLESLLSTNMLFSVCFPWPYSIYLHMTFSRFIDKSVKGQGVPQRCILSTICPLISLIFQVNIKICTYRRVANRK